MLDMIFNFLPGWLALYKTPMNPGTWNRWGRFRRLGCVLFVILVTLGFGGVATTFDICWGLLAHHQAIGGLGINFRLAWWFSGALVVGLVEWFVNESRFRLPPKPAAIDGIGSSRLGSKAL
jgi:hypothetical protein